VTAGMLAGLALASRLVDMQGRTSGMGAGIAAGLSAAALAEIVVLAVAIATAAGLLLAGRMVRIPDPASLRGPVRPPRRPAGVR
jgi:putative ABC transport system permease protein